jgi:hypothetical protein
MKAVARITPESKNQFCEASRRIEDKLPVPKCLPMKNTIWGI